MPIDFSYLEGAVLGLIEALKRILGVSLGDAHDLIFRTPCIIKKSTKSEAEDIKKQLEDAGAKIEIR